MKVTIVTASNGKCLELAKVFQTTLLNLNVPSSVIDLVDLDWPLYTSRNELKYDPKTLVKPVEEELSARAFIFIAPEYNGGTPPALSNFLCWVSRLTPDWRGQFNNKAALIATHSGEGLNILPVMRLQLAHFGMNVIGKQIHNSPKRPIVKEEIEDSCLKLIRDL